MNENQAKIEPIDPIEIESIIVDPPTIEEVEEEETVYCSKKLLSCICLFILILAISFYLIVFPP